MDIPVSLKATNMHLLRSCRYPFISCLNLAKKWMVSSTEIPNAIENTSNVEGLIGIPAYPIIPAVNNKGMKLGTNEATTILHDPNNKAIKKPITTMAIPKEMKRFVTRYCVPLEATTAVPVIVTSHLCLSMTFSKLSSKASFTFLFLKFFHIKHVIHLNQLYFHGWNTVINFLKQSRFFSSFRLCHFYKFLF